VHRTLDRHARRAAPRLATGACGAGPILAAIHAARALGATRGRVLSYAHSGETPAGDPARVVGYGAAVLDAGSDAADGAAPLPPPPLAGTPRLDGAQRARLLAIARETLTRFMTTDTVPLARGLPAAASVSHGAFVTLKKNGTLRGCVGTLLPELPLDRLVSTLALRSALNDPRFDRVRRHELDAIEIEVSVLTTPVLAATPESIVVGRDGVFLRDGRRSAVFLPEIPVDEGWTRAELLENLARKAGLPPDGWKRATLGMFRTMTFRESDFAPAAQDADDRSSRDSRM
jgi:AmmeMemoRadiSam system protein A